MKAINLEKMLPADIPPGEKILWFGRPEPVSFWRRAYRADWVAGYFMLLAAWNCASSAIDSGAVAATIVTFKTLGLGAAALALLALLAWLGARCVENGREIADILAQALSAASGEALNVPAPVKPAMADPAYAATAAA
jgi:hypothetical protein